MGVRVRGRMRGEGKTKEDRECRDDDGGIGKRENKEGMREEGRGRT